jgi:hypothetical protein
VCQAGGAGHRGFWGPMNKGGRCSASSTATWPGSQSGLRRSPRRRPLAGWRCLYRDGGTGQIPVGFIDWDIAAPGRRIHDIAHVCWQYPGLGPDVPDRADAGRRMRLICDAYRLVDRSDLPATILWWQDRCWRGIEAKAAAGDPAMMRLRDRGAVRSIRDAFDWVRRQRAELSAYVS